MKVGGRRLRLWVRFSLGLANKGLPLQLEMLRLAP